MTELSNARYAAGRHIVVRLSLIALLLLAPARFVQAWQVPDTSTAATIALDQEMPVSPAVLVGSLDNGLRYFIRENEEPENRAELRLVVNAGSILEDDDQLGLAHFLEHMAFNGTENFEKQELVSFMESIGMRLGPGVNASTSFDETIYQLEVPTSNFQNMETAFQILEDWANGLTLDPEEIDKERGVVIEEWRLGQGASSRLRDEQFPVLFRESRYAARLPIGTLESLQTFEHDALRRFYDDWYRPNLMTVIAVGDFNADDILDLTRDHFEDLTNPENQRERVAYGVPDHDETLFSIATDPELPSTAVQIYHKMEGNDDWSVGGYRQRMVERLYNGMLNDRFNEMSRQSNPPFLGASSARGDLIRTKGAYMLSAAVLENGIQRGLEALLIEAERVAQFGFTESELEREKAAAMRGMERTYTNRVNRSSGAFAGEYTRAFLEGESIPGVEFEYALYERFIPEITLGEVNRIGESWIRDANRVVLLTGPEKDDLEMPSVADLARGLVAAESAEITPYVDTINDQPLLASVPEGTPVVGTGTRDFGITEWTLANGVRVALHPTDYDEDQIVFQAFSPGGTSLAELEDYIPASTANTLVSNSGVGEFNSIDLGKVLAGKVANVSPFISTYSEGLTGTASQADLETMFQLIYLRFTAPRADPAIFDLWMTQNRQALANRNANPNTAFNDTYTRLIYGDHPRMQPPTLATLDEADLEESFEFYRDRFRDASDYTFVFVGNLDLDVMRPLVETYLGALPSTNRDETWRDIGVRTPEGVFEETVFRGLEPRGQTRIVFTGPIDYDDQAERTGIRAMAMTLETALRDVVREDLGGTYSIGISAGLSWQPVESYTLTVTFGSDPERMEELVQAVYDGIEAFKDEGPTREQVADTREALLRDFETSFARNRTVLGQLAGDYERGVEPGASIESYEDSAEAITPESMREMAERFFNMDNRIRVTLMPEGPSAN